ncbi:MAG: ATP-binding protein [Sideroxydans sp.]|nr:ATP-binding protein [Sideroxydans sp.]
MLDKNNLVQTVVRAWREQELLALVEQSSDAIARYDSECRRIYINSAPQHLAYGSPAKMLGTRPSEYSGGEQSLRYEQKIKQIFVTKQEVTFELHWNNEQGQPCCGHMRLTPEINEQGEVISVLGVGRDISELNRTRLELLQKDAERSRFLAAAGHDLRQPLAAANLFIDALKLTQLDAQQTQLIHNLDRAMANFSGLLDALLNISKLEAGIIQPQLSCVKLTEVFLWLEQTFAAQANKKQLAFKLSFPLRQKILLQTDLSLLKQVLQNLVGNALKFTSGGGILVSARLRGETVLFQVWDTGVGIAPSEVGQVFDEFYQVDNAHRDRNSGLGLGLAIAKRAARLLNTQLSLRSVLGRGTVLSLSIPNISERRASVRPAVSAVLQRWSDETWARDKQFCIVEDDALIAQALQQCLVGQGGSARCFSSAEAALAEVLPNQYYIVDQMLAGSLTGLQFLQQLSLSSDSSICAVMMTGDTKAEFIQAAAQTPWGVLHKPISMGKLLQALKQSDSRTGDRTLSFISPYAGKID